MIRVEYAPKSNSALIKLALSNLVFPSQSPLAFQLSPTTSHYIIALKARGRNDFRGLYENNGNECKLVHRDKLYAPSELTSEMVDVFYRYCS